MLKTVLQEQMLLPHKYFFKDRIDAGQKLAKKLILYKHQVDIVLSLARGGVVVGSKIAQILSKKLEVLIVRKIGLPSNPELGIGAITEVGNIYLNHNILNTFQTKENDLEAVIIREKEEIKRRINIYRSGKQLVDLENQTVVLVDDGVATGVTAQASISALRQLKAKKMICAAPIASLDAAYTIEENVDRLVTIVRTDRFDSIGSFYQNFTQVSDQEVVNLLQSAL